MMLQKKIYGETSMRSNPTPPFFKIKKTNSISCSRLNSVLDSFYLSIAFSNMFLRNKEKALYLLGCGFGGSLNTLLISFCKL